jgi:hypothetical protein
MDWGFKPVRTHGDELNVIYESYGRNYTDKCDNITYLRFCQALNTNSFLAIVFAT